MTWLWKIIPVVPMLVSLAEYVFRNKPKSGSEKKEYVKEIIGKTWDVVDDLDLIPQEKEKLIDAVIDATVKVNKK